jgi:phosphoribosyl-AMP cyclohydrolase
MMMNRGLSPIIFLIYSKDEAMRRSQVPGTVLYWAVKEGKVLHDGLA